MERNALGPGTPGSVAGCGCWFEAVFCEFSWFFKDFLRFEAFLFAFSPMFGMVDNLGWLITDQVSSDFNVLQLLVRKTVSIIFRRLRRISDDCGQDELRVFLADDHGSHHGDFRQQL